MILFSFLEHICILKRYSALMLFEHEQRNAVKYNTPSSVALKIPFPCPLSLV